MSDARVNRSRQADDRHESDRAPGDEILDADEPSAGLSSYVVGLGLAVLLTVVSFAVAGTSLVWQPSIPVALAVLAVAQMGVHLVFFLHITSGPDSTNNTMALAFGVLIVLLLIGGSLFIMSHLNHNMMPMAQVMSMQR
jgi:cytochrome o ubiquinol oxidase operon protein cyoD